MKENQWWEFYPIRMKLLGEFDKFWREQLAHLALARGWEQWTIRKCHDMLRAVKFESSEK